MVLSQQIMEVMTERVEFVKELLSIIKKYLRHETSSCEESKKHVNYNTCEGEIQIINNISENMLKIMFVSELKGAQN